MTLVKQYGDDGPYPNDASYQRVYQAPAATNEGIFMKLFESELEQRGWRPTGSGRGWVKGEFAITVGGVALNH